MTNYNEIAIRYEKSKKFEFRPVKVLAASKYSIYCEYKHVRVLILIPIPLDQFFQCM